MPHTTMQPSVCSCRAVEEKSVALVYQFPEEGTVLIQESLPGDWSIAQMRETVEAHANEPDGDPTAPRAFQMVGVRSTEGLLVQAHNVGRIMWIEDGILFDITGPTISPDQVLAIAEKV